MIRTMKLALLVVVIVTLASACGGKGKPTVSPAASEGDTAPQPTAQVAARVEPADTPAGPEVSGEDGEELSVSDRQVGLEDLSSYRAVWRLEWTSAGEDAGEYVGWEWTQEYSKEPEEAAHWGWLSMDSADDAEPEKMEFWQIGDTTYIITGGADGEQSCMSSSSEDNTFDSNKLSGPQTLGSVDGAKLVGKETVNGVSARHYRYDEGSMALLGGGKVKGDIWVAEQGGYVVKDTATWEGGLFGLSSDDKNGSGSWTWELTEVNKPIAITAPEGCESAATEMPLMDDATELASFGDMVTYKTATKQAGVLKFYRDAMTAAGWKEEGESMLTDEFATLTFLKDGDTVSLMISSDGDASNVVLTVQKAN